MKIKKIISKNTDEFSNFIFRNSGGKMKTLLKISIFAIAFALAITGLASASPYSEPASLLVFPAFTSSTQVDDYSMLTIVNTNTNNLVYVRFVLMPTGEDCKEYNFDIALTPNQITSFELEYIFPDKQGWIIAAAVDEDGSLIDFDYLIGEMRIKTSQGVNGTYNPIPFKKISSNENYDANGIIMFGETYTSVPKTIIEDNIPSTADGNQYFAGYVTSEDPLAQGLPAYNFYSFENGNVFTELENYAWDDAEMSFSFTKDFEGCAYFDNLLYDEPNLLTGFNAHYINTIIPSGRTGWIEFNKNPDTTLGLTAGYGVGAVKMLYNPNALGGQPTANAFNGVATMHRTGEAAAKIQISNKPVADACVEDNGNCIPYIPQY